VEGDGGGDGEERRPRVVGDAEGEGEPGEDEADAEHRLEPEGGGEEDPVSPAGGGAEEGERERASREDGHRRSHPVGEVDGGLRRERQVGGGNVGAGDEPLGEACLRPHLHPAGGNVGAGGGGVIGARPASEEDLDEEGADRHPAAAGRGPDASHTRRTRVVRPPRRWPMTTTGSRRRVTVHMPRSDWKTTTPTRRAGTSRGEPGSARRSQARIPTAPTRRPSVPAA